MPAEKEALSGEARAALARGDWAAARASFEAVLDQEETPEALLGLSEALWWLADTDGAVRCGERAYAGFRRRHELVPAVLSAMQLYFLSRVSLGNIAAARGWLGRAARLVQEHALAPLEGWVLLMRAHDSGDPAAAEGWAREARSLARRFGDADLELCALSQRGAALVALGRLEEGGALLDEAMAASLAGEGDDLKTVVFTSCNMISACSEVAEVERAAQWIRAGDEFSRRYGSPHLHTTCRTYYGAVLFATGDWTEAERQLLLALESGRRGERALYGEALARLAELRLAQGRLEEAERLLVGFEDHAATARAGAAVRLARGEAAAAAAIARRRLDELERDEAARLGSYRVGASVRLEAASLLELLVRAALAEGQVAEARAAADRLVALGDGAGCELIVAQAAQAVGRVLAHTGDRRAAVESLRRALLVFRRLGLPLETARTQLVLARNVGRRESAIAEARTALEAFERVGAVREADAAAALLRSLGASAARGGNRDTAVLTRREREVLELLAEGLSNKELAERLFLTRKTVEFHVRGILRKLGLRNRAEAAAYAVREL